jgi:hypothetical protein
MIGWAVRSACVVWRPSSVPGSAGCNVGRVLYNGLSAAGHGAMQAACRLICRVRVSGRCRQMRLRRNAKGAAFFSALMSTLVMAKWAVLAR